jgi:hypothetical protein
MIEDGWRQWRKIDDYVFPRLRFLAPQHRTRMAGLMNIQPVLSRSFILRVSLVFTVIAAVVGFVLAQDLAKQEDPLPPGSKQLIQPEELAQALKGAAGGRTGDRGDVPHF